MEREKGKIVKYAVMNAGLTALYIIFIGLFFANAEKIFGNKEPSVLIPIAMLSLFVFSAALCGGLFLGRPILWYLDGKKKEAIQLFGYTLAVFFVILLAIFAVVGLSRF